MRWFPEAFLFAPEMPPGFVLHGSATVVALATVVVARRLGIARVLASLAVLTVHSGLIWVLWPRTLE